MRWPWQKKNCMTLEDFHRIRREVALRMAKQDALDEEYLALPDRPRPQQWIRATEVSEPMLVDGIDYVHMSQWMAQAKKRDCYWKEEA